MKTSSGLEKKKNGEGGKCLKKTLKKRCGCDRGGGSEKVMQITKTTRDNNNDNDNDNDNDDNITYF